MPRVSYEELLSRLTKGKPVSAILLLGDEPFLRDDRLARDFAQRLVAAITENF